jgi:hypothetical protein
MIQHTGNVLSLTQQVNTNIKGGQADNHLSLTSFVRSNFHVASCRHFLPFNSRVKLLKVSNVFAINSMMLAQMAHHRVYFLTCSNYLGLSGSLYIPKYDKLNTQFVITSIAQCNVSKSTKNILTLRQTASFSIINAVETESSLALIQGATCYLIRG